MAFRSASLAEEQGYRKLRVLKEGLPAWRQAKQPVVVDPEYASTILDDNHVVIDLRSAEEATRGHLPAAVNIPASTIAAIERDAAARKGIPGLRDRQAPVVIYSNDTVSAEDTYRILGTWGYVNTTILDGGFPAWVRGAYHTDSGAPRAAINFTRKPLPGSVTADEFKRLVALGSVVVVDVREADEVAKGMIPGAIHIPLSKFNEEAEKLSPQDEILIHCAVGLRARMAYIRLKVRGYEHVQFLNDNIVIRKDGTYCIDCDQ